MNPNPDKANDQSAPSSLSFVALSFLFLSNMTPLFGVPMLYPVLWSIAVEEHFYLVWPWVVRHCRPRGFFFVLLSLILMGPVLRGMRIILGWNEAFYSW